MIFQLKRELQVMAVSAGSLLFIGPLSYFAVTGGVRAIDGWLGTAVFAGGSASTALTLFAVALSLLVASIAVDVRFEGFTAMNGRGRRTAIGYAACWLVVFAGAIVAIDLAVTMLGYGAGAENGPVVLSLSVLLMVALAGAAIRSGNAFRAGMRDQNVPE